MRDYYDVLNLEKGASYMAIDQAYERLAAQYRGDEVTLGQLVEAYYTLSNPLSRDKYDQALAGQLPDPSPTPRPTGKDAPPATSRPKTELLDTSPATASSPSPLRRPATEVVDVFRPAPPSHRPSTEVLETFVSPSPNRSSRPPTEPVAVPPMVGTPRQMTREEPEAGGSPRGHRPQTEVTAVPEKAAPPPRPSRPVPVGPIVVVVEPPEGPSAETELGEGVHVVGRPSKNSDPAVKLVDRFVSRDHAHLVKQGDSLVLVDQDSVNGTRLNGQRIKPHHPYPLGENDVVEIESFTLRVVFPPNAS